MITGIRVGSNLLMGAALARVTAANFQTIQHRFVPIYGGTFTMGVPGERDPYQRAHQATVSSFLLERNAVTNQGYADYLKLLGDRRFALIGSSRGSSEQLLALGTSKGDIREAIERGAFAPFSPKGLRIVEILDHATRTYLPYSDCSGPMKPVTQLTWDQAFLCSAFYGCSLPTEYEFEYAAKVHTGGVREFATASGELFLCGLLTHPAANIYSPGPVDVDDPYFKSLSNGLRHMLGNVAHWMQNWYGPYPIRPVTDPVGPEEGQYRAVRGVSWNGYDAEEDLDAKLRTTQRFHNLPNNQGYEGFRRRHAI